MGTQSIQHLERSSESKKILMTTDPALLNAQLSCFAVKTRERSMVPIILAPQSNKFCVDYYPDCPNFLDKQDFDNSITP